MGIFDKLGGKKGPAGGGSYFEHPGTYIVALEQIENRDSQQGGGELFIVESTVIEATDSYEKTHNPGERLSWLQNDKHGDIALVNVKGFLAALGGYSTLTKGPVDPDAEVWFNPNASEGEPGYQSPKAWKGIGDRAAKNGGQDFRGAILQAQVRKITTKKNQQKMSVVYWSAVDAATEKVYEDKLKQMRTKKA